MPQVGCRFSRPRVPLRSSVRAHTEPLQRRLVADASTPQCRADYHVGNALFEQRKYAAAEAHWRKALAIFERENETHPTTSAVQLKLAMVKMESGAYDEAV